MADIYLSRKKAAIQLSSPGKIKCSCQKPCNNNQQKYCCFASLRSCFCTGFKRSCAYCCVYNPGFFRLTRNGKIGRASCRERVEVSVVAVVLEEKIWS